MTETNQSLVSEASTNGDADHSAKVRGQSYTALLDTLHGNLAPATYFEIGTLHGNTLKLAKCSSIAVDPKFRITSDVIGTKPSCHFFQEPSDRFFRTRDPIKILGSEIDMAFLDGMHLFEFLLRDFMHTERFCRSNSVILLHDCLPPGFFMTVRDATDPLRKQSKFANWWTGDVWKIVPVLQKYRPDLSITITDSAPTGLVIITNLNPKSTVLSDSYAEIIREYSRTTICRKEYDKFWESVIITPMSEFSSLEQISTKLWI